MKKLMTKLLRVSLITLVGLAFCGCDKMDEAVKSGNLDRVKTLLKHHPDLVNNKDKYGETPLELATILGYSGTVALLIEKGADVNSKDTACGRTPLHYAWNVSVAGLLLANKAVVDARAKDGETPLFMAVNSGHKDVVELLLAHGADVNAETVEGETPIFAVQNVETAKLLLAHGANAKVRDNFGESPLHQQCDKAITELLLSNHVDVNVRNKNDETPLHTMARSAMKDVVDVLLAHGAEVNARDSDYSLG